MSNSTTSNIMKQRFSIRPASVPFFLIAVYLFTDMIRISNGRQAVGDGAFTTDITPSVLAVCQMQGTDDMYYYSTTFSGGPGVRSSDWVTDNLASIVPSSRSQFLPSIPQKSPDRPTAELFPAVVGPRNIPGRSESPSDLATPPLTPDDDDGSDASGISTKRSSNDALDLLLNIFSRNGLNILPFAKSVVVSAPNMGASFDGVVLDLPGKPKTLYVDGKNAPAVSLRESIVALLDLADEQLRCAALVIVLDKTSSGLSELLHSLMYVGGSVVTKPPFQVNPAYILVGLEI
ncbi:ornithine decarboxylase antizyme-domain-containing protein [Phlebopus sp. FC_14]|nr:ornithine decarboxylase antizyme-domain-containing protein [Phlebopus sp. FC_14]